jgi:hypothetical protein
VNQDRLICGLATCFNTMAHGGLFWTARMFDDWLRVRAACVLVLLTRSRKFWTPSCVPVHL